MANPHPNMSGLKPWKPGECPNRNGRPRNRPQSEANDAFLRSEFPESMRIAMNKGMGREVLEKGACWADAIAYALGRKALRGDSAAAKELRESVEGKSVMRVELGSPGSSAFEINVTFEAPIKRALDDGKVIDLAAPQLPAGEAEPRE